MRLYLGYSDIEITWVGQHFFCPLSNPSASLSVCPENRTGCGFAQHEHLCWRLQLNAPMLFIYFKNNIKMKSQQQNKGTNQKPQPFITASRWDVLFGSEQPRCIPVSPVTCSLGDGSVCAQGVPVFIWTAPVVPVLGEAGGSAAHHNPVLLAGMPLRLGSLRRAH